ncbi:MAG: hypothetical protein IJA23_03215, partial [Clostridia bacterium]|nr:hypothetical protein [Clostridia bacterium]
MIGEHSTFPGVSVHYKSNYQVDCNLTSNMVDKLNDSGNGVNYLQHWGEDNTDVSWTKQSFTWRYNRDIYAYAYYEKAEGSGVYDIYYYVPTDNTIGCANNIDRYTIDADTDYCYYTEKVYYNEDYKPLVIQLPGYTFKGWFIKPLDKITTGYVPGVTSSFVQDGYQENEGDGSFELEDDTTYLQDWRADKVFKFKYYTNVYAYAYFEVDTYTVNYYVPQDNTVGKANNTAKYQKVNGIDESFTTINFNESYKTLNGVLDGYTFLGW